MPRLAVALLLLSTVLAGCSDTPAADADPATPGVQDEAPVPVTVTHPGWQVGDWWTHDWSFVGQGAPQFTVKSIVSANASGEYTFSTDLVETAAQHGAFFFMDLGTMGADGVMTAGEFAFPWYQFPLTHNKTWTAQEVNLGDGFETVTRQLTMTARLNGSAADPVFDIEAKAGDTLYARYDFQPSLGWFGSFTGYRPDENGTAQVAYTIINSGQGSGYTGAIHDATGQMLVNTQPFIHPGSTSAPAQAIPFTLESGMTHVFAILYSFAAGGTHHTQLTAPDGQHWEATGAGDADGNPISTPVPSGTQVLAAAQAGQWTVTFAGAGVVAGGGCFLWGVNVASGTL